MIKAIAFPEGSLKHQRIRDMIGLDETLAKKAVWIERYKPALLCMLPDELNGKSDDEMTHLASALFDSLAFAGINK